MPLLREVGMAILQGRVANEVITHHRLLTGNAVDVVLLLSAVNSRHCGPRSPRQLLLAEPMTALWLLISWASTVIHQVRFRRSKYNPYMLVFWSIWLLAMRSQLASNQANLKAIDLILGCVIGITAALWITHADVRTTDAGSPPKASYHGFC